VPGPQQTELQHPNRIRGAGLVETPSPANPFPESEGTLGVPGPNRALQKQTLTNLRVQPFFFFGAGPGCPIEAWPGQRESPSPRNTSNPTRTRIQAPGPEPGALHHNRASLGSATLPKVPPTSRKLVRRATLNLWCPDWDPGLPLEKGFYAPAFNPNVPARLGGRRRPGFAKPESPPGWQRVPRERVFSERWYAVWKASLLHLAAFPVEAPMGAVPSPSVPERGSDESVPHQTSPTSDGRVVGACLPGKASVPARVLVGWTPALGLASRLCLVPNPAQCVSRAPVPARCFRPPPVVEPIHLCCKPLPPTPRKAPVPFIVSFPSATASSPAAPHLFTLCPPVCDFPYPSNAETALPVPPEKRDRSQSNPRCASLSPATYLGELPTAVLTHLVSGSAPGRGSGFPPAPWA